MLNRSIKSLEAFLNKKVDEYHQPFFIQDDPICVPHRFSTPQDIEIAGFFAAIFAWGNRKTIIQKTNEVMRLMDDAPHDFCVHHHEQDLKPFVTFVHRTFNATDLLYFIAFFRQHYQQHQTLETAFTQGLQPQHENVEQALNQFYHTFFSLDDAPHRTHKHIAAPFKHAACKRLNMFLRWMVRPADRGVDFGIWKNIQTHQLVIPLDVHVARVARHFQLIQRNANDWNTAVELTRVLKQLDPRDPVKYDYALFALGVLEKF
ncbi:MAG TPA: TIGR02757 family protein [Ferruginibacter sp.]|nr:TIGR02757 family protein [Ferruginibacter sp.]HRO17420.1 TIGR02757 family protein [Ferruginibacter sp.]HRQ20930.1 TIGR02757 family protein [Ferruginibacter sp.]